MKTVTTTILLGLCLLHSGFIHSEDERDRENPKDPLIYSREHRLIFHAVLEGLYEDGVSGEALELMIPDVRGMWIKDEPDKTNFVYSCPICMATFEALRLYKGRSTFYAQKGTRYTTFGPGVPEGVINRLKGSPQDRRDAIQELIQSWVKRRLDMMALTRTERTAIENNLKQLKKDGEAALKRFQNGEHGGGFEKHYANWEKCAACEAAAAAAGSAGN